MSDENTEATAETATVIADAPLTGEALIDTLDKDQLEDFARREFGREIDKRKRIDTLRDEVKALFSGHTQRVEAAAEAEAVAALTPRTPARCRHKSLKDKDGNLFEFEWNPLFEGNPDLEVIAYAE